MEDEVLHRDTDFDICEKLDFVKEVLQNIFFEFIENISVLGVVSQVDLEAVSWLDTSEIIKVSVVHHLTFDQCHKAIANTHDWEMLVSLIVVLLSPKQDFLDLFGILKSLPMSHQTGAISRYVETIDSFQF